MFSYKLEGKFLKTPTVTSNSIDWTGTSLVPAKNRGVHFHGTTAKLAAPTAPTRFYLPHTFTFTIWLVTDVTLAEATILCSSNNVTPATDGTNNPWLIFKINATGKLVLSLRREDKSDTLITRTSGLGVAKDTWAHVGFSI
jgi:hypothetical protein